MKVLDACLRMLHPFTPFVTEELWGHLKAAAQAKGPAYMPFDGKEWEDALIIARYPEPRLEEGWEAEKVSSFNLVQEVIRAIRNLRTEKRVPPSRQIPAVLAGGERNNLLRTQQSVIAFLAQIEQVIFRW